MNNRCLTNQCQSILFGTFHRYPIVSLILDYTSAPHLVVLRLKFRKGQEQLYFSILEIQQIFSSPQCEKWDTHVFNGVRRENSPRFPGSDSICQEWRTGLAFCSSGHITTWEFPDVRKQLTRWKARFPMSFQNWGKGWNVLGVAANKSDLVTRCAMLRKVEQSVANLLGVNLENFLLTPTDWRRLSEAFVEFDKQTRSFFILDPPTGKCFVLALADDEADTTSEMTELPAFTRHLLSDNMFCIYSGGESLVLVGHPTVINSPKTWVLWRLQKETKSSHEDQTAWKAFPLKWNSKTQEQINSYWADLDRVLHIGKSWLWLWWNNGASLFLDFTDTSNQIPVPALSLSKGECILSVSPINFV